MRHDSPLIAVATALLFAAAVLGAEEAFTGVERIVAVGDVHGDYAALTTLLRAAGVIDAEARWRGGRTHLVQVGDVVDRGDDVRRCLDLLMALEKQARRAGGRVHALIGNHEAMNLYGDLRYVSAGDYASFRDGGSQRARDRYYELHVKEMKRNPPAAGVPLFDDDYREKWFAAHPLGFVERMAAFSPDGRYGKWILGNPTAVKINNLVFMHGGISPKYAALGLKELNARVAAELSDFRLLTGGMVMDDEGPLWYRGLAQQPEAGLADHVRTTLERWGAERLVIGHTVTAGAVTPRFEGQVLMIDVGLSRPYGSRSACLVVEGKRIYALDRGKPVEFVGPPQRPIANRPPVSNQPYIPAGQPGHGE